ncbi:MAG TPA: hypothetical protein VEA78_13705, partial [Acidimicrobiales bacterium]|nr:hypothetical protein [Acidimicrobiales bacterium]
MALLGAATMACGSGDDDPGPAQASALGRSTVVEEAATAPELPAVEIVTTEYAFALPPTIDAGPVRLEIRNDGAEAHHVQLFELSEGATTGDFVGKMTTDIANVHDVGAFVGGTGPVPAGGTSAAEPLQ